MHFSEETDYVNRRAEIYASGDIEHGTALKFVNFIKEKKIGNAIIYLDSDGGSLQEGILIGKIIREMRYDTTIGTKRNKMSGICASACSYAFAGGLARYIYNDQQRLGLHQFYKSNGRNIDDVANTQQTTAKIVKYLSDMGVDEQAFVLASSTNKNTIAWLSRADSLKLNFANNGKSESTAEIKLMSNSKNGHKVYLRIEQVRTRGIAKLLFFCQDNKMYLEGMRLTNLENARIRSQSSTRNYFELDGRQFLVKNGQNGISAERGSVYFSRQLSDEDIQQILNSNVMSMWSEDGSNFRWGLEVDIYPVKGKMEKFMKSCNVSDMDLDTTLSYF